MHNFKLQAFYVLSFVETALWNFGVYNDENVIAILSESHRTDNSTCEPPKPMNPYLKLLYTMFKLLFYTLNSSPVVTGTILCWIIVDDLWICGSLLRSRPSQMRSVGIVSSSSLTIQYYPIDLFVIIIILV